MRYIASITVKKKNRCSCILMWNEPAVQLNMITGLQNYVFIDNAYVFRRANMLLKGVKQQAGTAGRQYRRKAEKKKFKNITGMIILHN